MRENYAWNRLKVWKSILQIYVWNNFLNAIFLWVLYRNFFGFLYHFIFAFFLLLLLLPGNVFILPYKNMKEIRVCRSLDCLAKHFLNVLHEIFVGLYTIQFKQMHSNMSLRMLQMSIEKFIQLFSVANKKICRKILHFNLH